MAKFPRKLTKDWSEPPDTRKAPLVEPDETDQRRDIDPRFDPRSPLFDEDAYEQAVIDWYKADTEAKS